jgi:flagellar basal-body rod protein FlgC
MTQSLSIFDISGRAMAAQLVRLNTTASNMANAGTEAGSEAAAYRSIKPVFQTVTGENGMSTVAVAGVVPANLTPAKRHEPGSPLADANGDVWSAAVDTTAELVDMMDAARAYQNNVQVLQTAKSLTLDTLRIGQ